MYIIGDATLHLRKRRKKKMISNYLKFISESRYKTHGLSVVKRTIPKLLESMNCDFNIEYSDVDDFVIYFTNLTNGAKEVVITRCELIGYFPSVFSVNGINKKPENVKDIDEFVKYVKSYELNKENKVYIQFESWLDEEIETPEKLYHVCRTIDTEKIKRYGLSPKSKHKISYHPDRIYLVDDYIAAISIINQFKEINSDKYSIVYIEPEKHKLLLRKDPNFNAGYYTTQNILPDWISDIKFIK